MDFHRSFYRQNSQSGQYEIGHFDHDVMYLVKK